MNYYNRVEINICSEEKDILQYASLLECFGYDVYVFTIGNIQSFPHKINVPDWAKMLLVDTKWFNTRPGSVVKYNSNEWNDNFYDSYH